MNAQHAKIDKESLTLLKQTIHISKEDMEDYNLAMFYTCHRFLQRTCKFEETNSKTFFYKPLEQFVNKGFGNAWQLALNRIQEAPKMNICNSKQASLGAT
jgi:hypothetical protein